MVDKEKIKKAIVEIIKAIGEDPERNGLLGTPERVANMYEEIFGADKSTIPELLSKTHELEHDEMVIIKDIPFYSMCEHHLLPFYGVAHVGYIPNSEGRIVGLSKMARVVETVARRPQVQERMTTDIADAINVGLNASGVGVVVQAEHMCMIMRGIKKPGSNVITSALRGSFRTKSASRAEFFSLIQG